MYISTLNIVKDIPDVEVINMTAPQTGCLHDYSLSTKDLKTLSSADIFVINGAGMESFLDDVIDEYSDLKIIEASNGISLIEDTDHDEHEQIVDAHRLLYDVRGVVLGGESGSVLDEDEDAEGNCHSDPHTCLHQGTSRVDVLRTAVKDEQVEGEEHHDDDREDRPHDGFFHVRGQMQVV